MNKLMSALQCKWCYSELVGPVILPCGHTVCSKHTDELVERKGKCLTCGQRHRIDYDDDDDQHQWPVNKLAVELLEAKLSKLNFGAEYDEAVEAVSELDSKLSEFGQAINHPADYLTGFFDHYKRQVDVKREEMCEVINKICEQVMTQINKTHTECANDVTSQNFAASYSLTQLESSASVKRKEWKQVLDELVINRTAWQLIKQQAKDFVIRIDSCLKSFTRTFHFSERHKFNNIESNVNEQVLEYIMNTKGIYSIGIDGVTRLDTSRKSQIVTSETFMIREHPFFFEAFFAPLTNVVNDQFPDLHLAVFLYSNSSHENEAIKVNWRLRVLGKYYDEIVSKKIACEYNKRGGYGFSDVISHRSIMKHPGFDWKSDMIRIEVTIRSDEDVEPMPIYHVTNMDRLFRQLCHPLPSSNVALTTAAAAAATTPPATTPTSD